MSEVNYKALMANDVSIMNLSENEIFSSFIVIDQNNKQYYVGAYDLDHLSDFVNANEPVSDFSEFQDTLRNYFFSTASSESVPNTYNPDELLKCKHLTEFARQLNIKLDGGTDPKLDRTIVVHASRTLNGTTGISYFPGDNLELKLALDDTKPYDLEIRLPIDYEQGVLPYLSDFSVEGEGLSTENSGWARTAYYAELYSVESLRGMWNLVITLAKRVACTVTATVNVPETDQYKAYSRTLTWHLVPKE